MYERAATGDRRPSLTRLLMVLMSIALPAAQAGCTGDLLGSESAGGSAEAVAACDPAEEDCGFESLSEDPGAPDEDELDPWDEPAPDPSAPGSDGDPMFFGDPDDPAMAEASPSACDPAELQAYIDDLGAMVRALDDRAYDVRKLLEELGKVEREIERGHTCDDKFDRAVAKFLEKLRPRGHCEGCRDDEAERAIREKVADLRAARADCCGVCDGGTLLPLLDDIRAAIAALDRGDIRDGDRRDLLRRVDQIEDKIAEGKTCHRDDVSKKIRDLVKKVYDKVEPGAGRDELVRRIATLGVARAACCGLGGSCDSEDLFASVVSVHTALLAIPERYLRDGDARDLIKKLEDLSERLFADACDEDTIKKLRELIEKADDKVDDRAGPLKDALMEALYELRDQRAQCCGQCDADDLTPSVAAVRDAVAAVSPTHVSRRDREKLYERLDEIAERLLHGEQCTPKTEDEVDDLERDAQRKIDPAAGPAKETVLTRIEELRTALRACCDPTTGCGNARVEPPEECDDGANGDPDDGCTDMCTLPVCGDHYVQPSLGEECDDGRDGDPDDDCTDECLMPACGDGYLQPSRGEECDDSNTTPGDGCDADCQIEPPILCGNGELDPGEECDDGNTRPGDGCDEHCRWETECGNGVVDPGEACDDGNRSNADTCSNTCECQCGLVTADTTLTCDISAIGDGASACISFARDDVTLDCDGHAITRGDGRAMTAIFGNRRSGVTVRGCEIEGFHTGVWLANGKGWTIEDSGVTGAYTSVLLQAQDGDFEDVTVAGNHFDTSDMRTTVWGLRVIGQRAGSASTGFSVRDNTVLGRARFTAALSFDRVSGVSVEGNSVIDLDPGNGGIGVRTLDSSGFTIAGNELSDLRYGVGLWSGGGHTLSANRFDGNEAGISVGGPDNVMRDNVFHKSPTQLALSFYLGPYASDIDTSNVVEGAPIHHFDGTYAPCPRSFFSRSAVGRLDLVGCAGTVVRGVRMDNGDGIYLWGTTGAIVTGADVARSPWGIHAEEGHGNRIMGSTLTDVVVGIAASRSEDYHVTGNTFVGGGIALWSQHFARAVVRDNVVRDQTYFDGFPFGAFQLEGTVVDTEVTDNTISGGSGYGIFLQSFSFSNSRGNTFASNTVQRNAFADLKVCASSGASSTDMLIHGNTFTPGEPEPMEFCNEPRCARLDAIDNHENGVRITDDGCY